MDGTPERPAGACAREATPQVVTAVRAAAAAAAKRLRTPRTGPARTATSPRWTAQPAEGPDNNNNNNNNNNNK